ncbi:hypothetical protein J1N35_015123 [Gossypium stocksii]|uniref:Reverse transcriptase n=1 Tax=Gossypium stocksii TaxID=47602 RepID=A0A9D3VVQ5_9ROSI|nr:hypothetical protein J1N35_015123 [Gossypium stocksii]
MKRVTAFQLGRLTVRHLRVPLVTRKLNATDCAPLIEKLTGRINSWSSKQLSYAARLQLIKAVIYKIKPYWCRRFLLPKGVLKKSVPGFIIAWLREYVLKDKCFWDVTIGSSNSWNWKRLLKMREMVAPIISRLSNAIEIWNQELSWAGIKLKSKSLVSVILKLA